MIEVDDITKLKAQFAANLLKTPNDPYAAALLLFPDNSGKCLQAMNEWPRDPIVRKLVEETQAEYGAEHFLPDKAKLAQAIWDIAEADRDADTKLKALKLYADIRGFIVKDAGVTVNNNSTTNKVMIVKQAASDAEWENGAQIQQRKLIAEANGPIILN